MRFHFTICIGSAACLFMGSAMADTFQSGFEPPDYSIGNINGQQGWSKTGLYDAAVSSAGAFTGSQSLRISNGITSGSFGDQTFTPHLSQAAGEGLAGLFFSSWYFMPVTPDLQDGMGISVSPDNGAGARMSYLRMQEDATNGLNLLFYDTDPTGNFVSQLLATNLDRTVWHRIDLNIQFFDGPHNDVVQVFLDGAFIGGGTTWEDFQRFGPAGDGGGGGLAPVNSLLFAARGTAAPDSLGKGFYIDDVTLESSPTPEPGTAAMMLGGCIAVVLGIRRHTGGDKYKGTGPVAYE